MYGTSRIYNGLKDEKRKNLPKHFLEKKRKKRKEKKRKEKKIKEIHFFNKFITFELLGFSIFFLLSDHFHYLLPYNGELKLVYMQSLVEVVTEFIKERVQGLSKIVFLNSSKISK